MTQTFKKKPVVIEAVQWNGDNITEITQFMSPTNIPYVLEGQLMIPTLEGTMSANNGDWIIKGVKGEFYPCKPDIFIQTYEPTE